MKPVPAVLAPGAPGRPPSPVPPGQADGAPLNPRRWQALAVLAVGPFLSLFDQFCVNLAAPSINRSFTLAPLEFQAVVGGYSLVYGLGLITGGRLGDLFGRRRVYRVGLALFAVTSLACALAWSPAVLIVARLAQGAAAAVLQPQVLALIRVQFPPAERARALSWYGVSMSLGMICGQVLGGAIPSWDLLGLGWRPVFLVAVPLCAVAHLAIARTLPADRAARAGQGIDGAGIALSATGFALLLLPLAALQEGSFLPAGPVLLAAAALLLTVFVAHQTRRERGDRAVLLPVRLFAGRTFGLGVLLNFLLYMSSVPFAVMLGLYLQDESRLSPAVAGLVFTPAAVAIAAGSRLAPALQRRFGLRVLVVAAALTAAGLAGALATVGLGTPDAVVLPLTVSFAVYGLGNGMIVPLLTGVVLAQVPPQDAGAGSGVLSTAQQLGAAAGIAVIGAFLYPAATGAPLRYADAMWAGTSLAVLGVVCAALLTSAARRQRPGN
ncbi:MFS transporter [Streptomyces griseoflavus]|uniref:MFS transporter n=1 Tax=Streptomyces griseoflavus TaxID=35619 RepID=UPI00167C45FA|nr:MFS transporter [Streptomyces griseoflavus]GGV44752.1 MFS transporter [Streptomyces griseoflavus]